MPSLKQFILYRLIRLISKIQETTVAKHTAYYILIESLLIGLIISLLNQALYLSVLNLVLSFTSYLLFGISSYTILVSRSKNTPDIVEINKYITIILIFISHIPVVFLYIITYRREPTLILSISILIYTIILIRRNKKYLRESEFFVNKYSSIQGSWIEGSVKLEKAIKHMEENSLLRAYYWGLRSEWTYNRITRGESLEFKEIAAELSAVGNLISASALSGDINVYKKEVYKRLESAFSMESDQTCSKCNQQLQVGSIYDYEKKDNLCKNCDRISSINIKSNKSDRDPFWEKYSKQNLSRENRETSSNSTRKNRRQRRRSTTSYRRQRWNKNDQTDNKTNNETNKNENHNKTKEDQKRKKSDDIDDYLDILNLSDLPTRKELKQSYRKRVKQTHPDSGGSSKQFKKVKNAYNKLQEEIQESKKGK